MNQQATQNKKGCGKGGNRGISKNSLMQGEGTIPIPKKGRKRVFGEYKSPLTTLIPEVTHGGEPRNFVGP